MAVEKRRKQDFTAAGKSGCSWTSDEVRYLQRHRADGSDLIAHVLGRTTGAVQQQAHRLGVSLRIRHGETCPMCGEHIVREGTAAAKQGMCQVCWERRKADAMRERAAEQRAKADYEAAKKLAQTDSGRSSKGPQKRLQRPTAAKEGRGLKAPPYCSRENEL